MKAPRQIGGEELPIADDPTRLADTRGWAEDLHADFLDLQNGTMSKNDFGKKYLRTRAILDLDMTGFGWRLRSLT